MKARVAFNADRTVGGLYVLNLDVLLPDDPHPPTTSESLRRDHDCIDGQLRQPPIIEVEGLHKAWTFKNRMTIPLAHVRQVTDDPAGGSPPACSAAATFPDGHCGHPLAATANGTALRVTFATGKAIVVELAENQ